MAGEVHRGTLGDYFTLQRGTTYKSRLLGQPGPVLLGLATIQRNGGFRRDSLQTYGGDSPDKLIVQPGELYLSLKDVTQSADLLGAVARLPRDHTPGRLTQDTVKLEPRGADVPLDYLYWLLRTPQYRSYCRSHATGTTNLGLAREDFLAFPAPEPKPMQLGIVETLGTLDDKIELNRRMSETLEATARALFKSWFVDFDPVRAKQPKNVGWVSPSGRNPPDKADGGLRDYAANPPYELPPHIADLFPARLVDSELGEIPAGWEVYSLGELVETVKGRSYKSEELVESDTALVTLKSFKRGGGYRADGLKSFAGKYKPEQVVSPGELVTACTDVTQAAEVIGRPAIVRATAAFRTLVASLDTLIVRPSRKGMTRAFLYFLAGTEEFVAHTYAHTTGTTVLHLAKEAVPSFRFARPSARLVESFDSLASPVLERIQASEQESDTLAALRDALLPKLISGELRVKEAGRFLEATT